MKKRVVWTMTLALTLLLCACGAQQLPDTTGNENSEEGVESLESATEAVPSEEHSTEVSLEMSTEETEPTEPTEKPTAPPAPTQPVPTNSAGELLGNPANSRGEDFYSELLPYSDIVFEGWTKSDCEVDGDFYYKDHAYPMVNDFAYTLHKEPSISADIFMVEPYTLMYPKATDRLHWVYLETLDGSIGGWLSITFDEDHYDITPMPGDAPINIDDTSFALMWGQEMGYAPSICFGEMNGDASLVSGLKEGEMQLLTFSTKAELQMFIVENETELRKEPALWDKLDAMLSYSYRPDSPYVLTFFRDSYRGANGMIGFMKEQEDGTMSYVLMPHYNDETLASQSSVYFHIGSTKLELTDVEATACRIVPQIYDIETLSGEALTYQVITWERYLELYLTYIEDRVDYRFKNWGVFRCELIWWNKDTIFYKQNETLETVKSFSVCEEGEPLLWVDFSDTNTQIEYATTGGRYGAVNTLTGELLPSTVVREDGSFPGFYSSDLVSQDGALNFYSNGSIGDAILSFEEALITYDGTEVKLEEGQYILYRGDLLAFEEGYAVFNGHYHPKEEAARDTSSPAVNARYTGAMIEACGDPGVPMAGNPLKMKLAENCHFFVMTWDGSLIEVSWRDFNTVLAGCYETLPITLYVNAAGEVVGIAERYEA